MLNLIYSMGIEAEYIYKSFKFGYLAVLVVQFTTPSLVVLIYILLHYSMVDL